MRPTRCFIVSSADFDEIKSAPLCHRKDVFCDAFFTEDLVFSRLRINVIGRVDLDAENKVARELFLDLVNYAFQ